MDLSEQCGYSGKSRNIDDKELLAYSSVFYAAVQAQIQLFQSIKPLFANKIVFVVINKVCIYQGDFFSQYPHPSNKT